MYTFPSNLIRRKMPFFQIIRKGVLIYGWYYIYVQRDIAGHTI